MPRNHGPTATNESSNPALLICTLKQTCFWSDSGFCTLLFVLYSKLDSGLGQQISEEKISEVSLTL